jgi:A/G-specific adenine glycosylase
MLSKEKPGDHNQAMMEFGALQCVPSNPLCEGCVLKKSCYAFKNDKVNSLPPKKEKLKKKTRYFNFILIVNNRKIYVQKRGKNDIWPNLYQFPVVETNNRSNKTTILKKFEQQINTPIKNKTIIASKEGFRHLLSHQVIIGKFYFLRLANDENLPGSSFILMNRNELNKLAFPKPLASFLEKLSSD